MVHSIYLSELYHFCNLWNSCQEVITILQMEDIERKFNNELYKDSFVIACRFPLPNTRPIITIGHGVDTVWVYRIPHK